MIISCRTCITPSCFRVARHPSSIISLLGLIIGLGCSSAPKMMIRADHYALDVTLNPASHRIAGQAAIDLHRLDEHYDHKGRRNYEGHYEGPVAVDLLLHPDLRVNAVRGRGVKVIGHRLTQRGVNEGGEFHPATHTVILTGPVEAMTLLVDFNGTLFQDVSTGEIPGQIHNFEMRAHIGDEGIFLSNGYWYPQTAVPDDAPRVLADFTLTVATIPDLTLAASGERDPLLAQRTGGYAWRTPFPIEGMTLVGGHHQVYERQIGRVNVQLYLKDSQAEQSEGLFDAVQRNLVRYQPLLGPYPAREYAVVDNFFSSGFAYPMFTLLSSAVIDMGERSQTTHGYLDHEMLHCWWGNGVHVDPQDGNWCEALATYAANYYGHVLDGNESEARRKRRNYCHFLSRSDPGKDQPLGRFGLDKDVSRSVGYSKGAMVFHMLARKMGQDQFWEVIHRFNGEFLGRYASWSDIIRMGESIYGDSLTQFTEQWVRRSDAPTVWIDQAEYDQSTRELRLTIRQTEPAFHLELPLRVSYGHHTGSDYTDEDYTADLSVTLPAQSTLNVRLPVASGTPQSVELDPDFHLFRRVSKNEIIPTTASTRSGNAFAVISPSGPTAERYAGVQSIFESSFKPEQRLSLTAGAIPQGVLAERCVLILGRAVYDPYVAGFLSAVDFPVHWVQDGFEYEDRYYTRPDQAILCTARQPGVDGGGVTVLFANSEEAIPKPMNIPMYDQSLIIFENGKPILRRDFEVATVVPIESR